MYEPGRARLPLVLGVVGLILLASGAVVSLGREEPEATRRSTLTFRQVLGITNADVAEEDRPEITEGTPEELIDRRIVIPGRATLEGLTIYELAPASLTGEAIADGSLIEGAGGQGSVVNLTLDDEGREAWAELTGTLACLRDQGQQVTSQVAIVLGKVVQSTGSVGEPLSTEIECETGITSGRMSFPIDNPNTGRLLLHAAGIETEEDEGSNTGVAVPLLATGGAALLFALLIYARDKGTPPRPSG